MCSTIADEDGEGKEKEKEGGKEEKDKSKDQQIVWDDDAVSDWLIDLLNDWLIDLLIDLLTDGSLVECLHWFTCNWLNKVHDNIMFQVDALLTRAARPAEGEEVDEEAKQKEHWANEYLSTFKVAQYNVVQAEEEEEEDDVSLAEWLTLSTVVLGVHRFGSRRSFRLLRNCGLRFPIWNVDVW